MEQECVSDIKELLLEHPHMFTLSEEVALPTINALLKVPSLSLSLCVRVCVCVCVCV